MNRVFKQLFLLSTLLCSGHIFAGQISVTKQVVAGNTSNTFDIVIDGTFIATITDGQNTGFVSVTDGSTVTISEFSNGMSQYDDVAYLCFDGTGAQIANGTASIASGGGGGSATFSVTIPTSTNPLETTVNCTLYNIKRSRFLLSKSTFNGDSSTVFNFTTSGGGTTVLSSLTGGQTDEINLGNNFAGTITVTETVPATWQVENVFCLRLTDGAVLFDGVANPVSVTLARGDDVLCVFTNGLLPGRILVDKVTIPSADPQTFTFNTNYSPDFSLTDADPVNDSGLLRVDNGTTYTVSEVLPGGWVLASASCDNGDDPSAITLSAGAVVTCTFVNDKIIADLSVTKDNSQATFTPGTTFTYVIEITNNGPDSADGTVFADTLPAWAEGVTWTCSAINGAVCPNNAGSGNTINETIATLPNTGVVTYSVSGTYSADMSVY